MGYSITIGQLKTEIHGEGIESLDAADANEIDAPAYGEPTDYTNSRWPSYTSWGDAMDFIGLEDLMFNEDTGLMREHPGCFPLTQEHKAIIDKAHKAYYAKYPNAVAGYAPEGTNEENWPEYNGYATRLEWLKYWVDWALENCENPVLSNS